MQVLVLAVQNAVDYCRPGRGDLGRDAVSLDRRIAGDGDRSARSSPTACAASSKSLLPAGRGGAREQLGRGEPERRSRICRRPLRAGYLHAFSELAEQRLPRRLGGRRGRRSASRGSSASCRCARRSRPAIWGTPTRRLATPTRWWRSSTCSAAWSAARGRGRSCRRVAARAGVELSPAGCWLLAQAQREPAPALATLAAQYEIELDTLTAAREELAVKGLIVARRRTASPQPRHSPTTTPHQTSPTPHLTTSPHTPHQTLPPPPSSQSTHRRQPSPGQGAHRR